MARLSRRQVALLHTAPAALGVDEATRRTVQRNVGGSESAATMGAAGFARVMAWWEERGWTDPVQGPGYWTGQAADGLAPMRAKVVRLLDVLGWRTEAGALDYGRLAGMVERQTAGRTRRLDQCRWTELYDLIEALKCMARRDPAAARRLR